MSDREKFLAGCILNNGPEAFDLLRKCGVAVGMLRDPLAVRVWREAEKQETEHPGEWEGGNVVLAIMENAPECEADLLTAQSQATTVAKLESEAREIVAADAGRRGVELAGELAECLKGGRSPRAVLASLVDLYNGGTLAGAAVKEKPFSTVVRFGDFMAQTLEIPPAVVEGFLLRSEVTLLSAEAKLGKTWFLLQLAECVAAGIPFLGWRTVPGAVLYLNMEVGAAMMQQRARMVAERLGVEDPPVYFVNALDEPRPPTLKTLESKVKATVAALEAKHGRLAFALVIIDPFYALAVGLDENSASEVSGACRAFKRVAHEVNAAVVVAHHTGKGDPSGRRVCDRSRGSSAFSGAVDNPLSLTLKTEDADGKVAQLAGRWRNLPGLPPHDLRFDSAIGLWEDLGEGEPMGPQGGGGGRGRPALYTVEGLVEMFKDAPEGFMRRQDFIDKGVGKNAITPLLNEAVELGRIVRTRSGSGDVYRLAEVGDGLL